MAHQLLTMLGQSRTLEREIEVAENELKAKKRRLRTLQEEEIPEAMGPFRAVTLEDGTVIERTSKMRTSIRAEKRADAITWLKNNKAAALVKGNITIPFQKGELPKAQQLAKDHEGATVQETIAAPTLEKFGREMYEEGEMLPEELFSCYLQTTIKVKQPKN